MQSGKIVYLAVVNINVKKVEQLTLPNGQIAERVHSTTIVEAQGIGPTQRAAFEEAERQGVKDFVEKLDTVVQPNLTVVGGH